MRPRRTRPTPPPPTTSPRGISAADVDRAADALLRAGRAPDDREGPSEDRSRIAEHDQPAAGRLVESSRRPPRRRPRRAAPTPGTCPVGRRKPLAADARRGPQAGDGGAGFPESNTRQGCPGARPARPHPLDPRERAARPHRASRRPRLPARDRDRGPDHAAPQGAGVPPRRRTPASGCSGGIAADTNASPTPAGVGKCAACTQGEITQTRDKRQLAADRPGSAP